MSHEHSLNTLKEMIGRENQNKLSCKRKKKKVHSSGTVRYVTKETITEI